MLSTYEVCVCVGEDSTLRCFSTVHDSHNKSLGRASYNKTKTKRSGLQLDEHRMPPIIDFASGISVVISDSYLSLPVVSDSYLSLK